ncbi:MAG: hypothetical protein ROZ37_14195 [Aromatoleum sp.]|uniref:hypothetical protein n=1 Tax=Aromatoleum sp. TaxID=2307007 RepID=UPI0028956299|nr:hypothetical protein [Aromatoleum sp.]MDT3671467.1 hypothetical protein [Aromatoleum sp.]
MKTTGRTALRSLVWVTAAVAVVAIAAEGRTDRPRYSGAATAQTMPSTAVGALVFDADGGITVVDREGRPVPGCVIPGTGGGTDAPPCAALSGTTVQSLKSVGFIRHTGSTCTTIGPLVNAGLAFYFQLPPGCAP